MNPSNQRSFKSDDARHQNTLISAREGGGAGNRQHTHKGRYVKGKEVRKGEKRRQRERERERKIRDKMKDPSKLTEKGERRNDDDDEQTNLVCEVQKRHEVFSRSGEGKPKWMMIHKGRLNEFIHPSRDNENQRVDNRFKMRSAWANKEDWGQGRGRRRAAGIRQRRRGRRGRNRGTQIARGRWMSRRMRRRRMRRRRGG